MPSGPGGVWVNSLQFSRCGTSWRARPSTCCRAASACCCPGIACVGRNARQSPRRIVPPLGPLQGGTVGMRSGLTNVSDIRAANGELASLLALIADFGRNNNPHHS